MVMAALARPDLEENRTNKKPMYAFINQTVRSIVLWACSENSCLKHLEKEYEA